MTGTTNIRAAASPLGVVFVRQAMVLDSQAREHKRLEKHHRRQARQVRAAQAALLRDAEALGYPINIEGEAEEESHGPDRNTTHPHAAARAT